MDVGVWVGVGVSAGLGVIITTTGAVAVGVGITAEVIGTTTAGDVAIGIGSGVGRNNLRTANAAPTHKTRTMSPNTIIQTTFVRCLAIKSGYSRMTTPLHSGTCQFFLHSPSLPLLAPKPTHLRIHAGLVHRVETAMDILVLPLASWCYCSTEVDWRVVQRESGVLFREHAASLHPSRPISRVLSWAIIYLGRRLPAASSDLPGTRTGRAAPRPPKRVSSLLGLAPGGGCLAAAVTSDAGGLLHHLFTLTRLVDW